MNQANALRRFRYGFQLIGTEVPRLIFNFLTHLQHRFRSDWASILAESLSDIGEDWGDALGFLFLIAGQRVADGQHGAGAVDRSLDLNRPLQAFGNDSDEPGGSGGRD